MGKLSAKSRKALPTKDFAGKDRSYPVEDRGHAKAAIARAKEYKPSDEKSIVRKAEAKLHGHSRSKGSTSRFDHYSKAR